MKIPVDKKSEINITLYYRKHRHQTLCQYEYIISNGQKIVSNIYIGHYFLPIAYDIFILTKCLVPVQKTSNAKPQIITIRKKSLFSVGYQFYDVFNSRISNEMIYHKAFKNNLHIHQLRSIKPMNFPKISKTFFYVHDHIHIINCLLNQSKKPSLNGFKLTLE